MAGTREKRKLKVGVLRGGPSDEYEVSLKTGKNLIDALRDRNNYEVQDIFVDRSGVWHIDGVARPVERIFPHIDVVVNAMHGQYGEDGRVQQLLEAHRVPFTGSGALGSAIAMNKPLAKKFFRENGLLTPEHLVIKKHEHKPSIIERILSHYPHLKLIKPASSGSSLGVKVAKNYEEYEEGLEGAFNFSDSVLVEEFIKGREATCGVMEGTEGNVYALHPVEIRDLSTSKTDVWGYESKYSD
ncbi:MAG TPA: D-alanine--D-alanine ligase, partial [Candidatus Nanoarchaeia archaeon]|nr:D-alanine--D-alanine ligase [Candidatus Nanoarchaeia archaeon]